MKRLETAQGWNEGIKHLREKEVQRRAEAELRAAEEVELEAVQNLLKSVKLQDGLPGPASNLKQRLNDVTVIAEDPSLAGLVLTMGAVVQGANEVAVPEVKNGAAYLARHVAIKDKIQHI